MLRILRALTGETRMSRVNPALAPGRAPFTTRIGGRHVLLLSHNPVTEALYASLNHRLAA